MMAGFGRCDEIAYSLISSLMLSLTTLSAWLSLDVDAPYCLTRVCSRELVVVASRYCSWARSARSVDALGEDGVAADARSFPIAQRVSGRPIRAHRFGAAEYKRPGHFGTPSFDASLYCTQ